MGKHIGFDKLQKQIAARGDVRDAAAVAYHIGVQKYGKKKMAAKAAAGRKKG